MKREVQKGKCEIADKEHLIMGGGQFVFSGDREQGNGTFVGCGLLGIPVAIRVFFGLTVGKFWSLQNIFLNASRKCNKK